MPPPTLNKANCMLCKEPEKPLFMFPKDPKRLKAWLDNIGKSHWLTERNEVYVYNNGRLCSKHFKDEAYTSTLKTKLLRFASPISVTENCRNIVQNEDTSVSSNSTLYQLLTNGQNRVSAKQLLQGLPSVCPPSLSPIDDTETVSCDQRTPKTKEIQRLRCANSKLKKKLFKTQQTGVRKTLEEQLKDKLSKRQYEFVATQLKAGNKVHPNGRRWTSKDKALSLSIFYRSSNTYNALRKTYGLALPCRTTLKNATGNAADWYITFCH